MSQLQRHPAPPRHGEPQMSRPRPADAENAGPTGTVSASAVAIGNVVRGFGAEVSGNGGGGGDADDVKISFRQGACVKAGEPGMQAGATTSGGPVQRIDNNQTIPLGELQLARESVQQAKALLVRLRGLVLALPGAPGTSFRATLELDPSRFVVYFAPLAGQRKLELLLTAPALDRFLQVAADKRQLQITFAAKIDGSKFIRAAGAEAHLQDPHLPIEQWVRRRRRPTARVVSLLLARSQRSKMHESSSRRCLRVAPSPALRWT
jgi:hypothetical protein